MRRATRRWSVVAGAALAAAAATRGIAGDEAGTKDPSDRFVVHEWGTFTSMQGTDGVVLEGLTREEESLPHFVYSRSEVRDCPLRAQGWKGLEVAPERVTQKMETPVIYFHSAKPRRVRVRVDFVKGLLTQWFPVSDLLGPPEGARAEGPLDVSKVDRSFLQWDVDLQPAGTKCPADAPAVAADDPWSFAREVEANWLRTAPRQGPGRAGPVETERYLFYRGLGNFELPLDAAMWVDDAVVLRNRGDVAIAGALVYEIRGDQGRITETSLLSAGATTKAVLPGGDSWGPVADVEGKLQTWVKDRLTKEGLHDDEARAMVRTWTRSWFRTEGTRVLWFVPRGAVDKILPLSVDPAPDELIRVLVGRTEVIPPAVAAEVEAAVRDRYAEDEAKRTAAEARLARLGRFVEPHVRNVEISTKDDETRKHARRFLAELGASVR
jgi:hypothetical protein